MEIFGAMSEQCFFSSENWNGENQLITNFWQNLKNVVCRTVEKINVTNETFLNSLSGTFLALMTETTSRNKLEQIWNFIFQQSNDEQVAEYRAWLKFFLWKYKGRERFSARRVRTRMFTYSPSPSLPLSLSLALTHGNLPAEVRGEWFGIFFLSKVDFDLIHKNMREGESDKGIEKEIEKEKERERKKMWERVKMLLLKNMP